MFTFTPLLGAQSSASKASQSILELDGGVKILVDVGWDDTFDPLDLVELEKYKLPFAYLPKRIAFSHGC
jgi:cleavage and polyadenylation specificity factor subunit 2